MIWKLAAIAEHEGTSDRDDFYDPTIDSCLLHPLRTTCRSISHEATPYIFNFTVFSIIPLASALRRFCIWLQRIGPENRRAIHRFCPRWDVGNPAMPHEWAQLFKELPGLRHVVIKDTDPLGGDFWSELLCGDCLVQDGVLWRKRRELFEALQALPNLSSWSCEAGSPCMSRLITAAPTLKALQINDTTPVDETHLPDLFASCLSLRYLHLGSFPDKIWRDLASSEGEACGPPRALNPRYLYDVPRHAHNLTADHTSGVHIIVNSYCEAKCVPSVDFSPLLSQCPHLTYLALECGQECSHLKVFPESLKTVALLFEATVDMQELARCLLALSTRCRALEVMAIIINWHYEFACSSHEFLTASEPVLDALGELKKQGIHVVLWIEFAGDVAAESSSENDDASD